MLAIKEPSDVKQTLPNLLPCSIKHNGPTSIHERYWKPERAEDGNYTAYFRGRKLRGKDVKVPDGYQGAILLRTDKVLSEEPRIPQLPTDGLEEEDESMEDDRPAEVKMMETQSTFDNMIVWSHDSVPDTGHKHIKGIEEWIAMAEAIHSNDAT